MSLKYCDDHCYFFDPNGECPKCKAGYPGYIRERNEINPDHKERIADLEKRGLIKSK